MRSRRKVPVLMAVVIVAKLVGMLRDMVLANYFGTSAVSDAYIIASTVPTTLFFFIGQSIQTSFLPIFNRVRLAGGEEKGLRYTNNLLSVVGLVCVILVSLLLLLSSQIVGLFASGFDAPTAALAARFVRICAPSLFAMSLVSLFTGYPHAHESFLPVAAMSLPRNAFIMLSIVLAAKYDLDWLGWGLLLAYMGELLLLAPFAVRKGYRLRPVLQLRDPDLEETGKMVAPVLLGLGVSRINKIIDRSLASTVVTGGVSALSYASIINIAVQEILVTSLITVLFASCSELISKKRDEEAKKQLHQTIDLLLTLFIPASLALILLARPVISVVLGRGQFNEQSLELTMGAYRCYTAGLLFLALKDVLVRMFYAYKDTKTATVTSVVSILLNIALNLSLYRWLGLNGLAIATAISTTVHSLALYVLLRKRIGDYGLRDSLSVALKSALGSAVMLAALIALQKLLPSLADRALLQLAVLVPAGVLVYAGMELLLKNPSLNRYFRHARHE